jgi:hypothetical protein
MKTKLVDATGEGVPGVIIFKGGKAIGTTDENGAFDFQMFVEYTTKMLGFQDATIHLSVDTDTWTLLEDTSKEFTEVQISARRTYKTLTTVILLLILAYALK